MQSLSLYCKYSRLFLRDTRFKKIYLIKFGKTKKNKIKNVEGEREKVGYNNNNNNNMSIHHQSS